MNPKQKLKKKLDRLIQEKYVPLNPFCFVCGGITNCMHHFVQKCLSLFLRWDIRNLIPLCSSCHTRHHRGGDPSIHAAIIRKKGFKWYDELERERRTFFKDTMENLREIEKELL